MDYKYLLILLAVYSAGLTTQPVLRAAREGFRMLARALSGVKKFKLYIEYRNDDSDGQGSYQVQRRVLTQNVQPPGKVTSRSELTEGALTKEPAKRLRGVGDKDASVRKRRHNKGSEPLRESAPPPKTV